MTAKNKKNICLCGFMGSGKTTVGKKLAKMMNYGFVDLDKYIENEEGMPVREIFSTKGEEYFRQKEHEALTHFCLKENYVISAGGGALTFERNIEAARKSCYIVFLDISLEVAQKRLINTYYRPLLNRSDRKEFITDLYNRRRPVYQTAADLTLDAEELPFYICRKIIKAFRAENE